MNPIPKSPDNNPHIPSNYRGISLLSVTGKLYTASISYRISKYLEDNNLLCNEQNGFRPNRSCLDHIFSLHNICKVRKSLRQETYITFIDFQKAFDYVNHDLLYHKLLNIGITNDLYKAIKAIYSHPQSCVQLNGHLSEWFNVESGVRQGDLLSPTLFAVFIDDLSHEVKDVNAGIMIGGEQLHMLFYADDIVLISPTVEKAQHQLDVLSNWCYKWDMKINAKKSQVLNVRNYQKPRQTKALSCCGQVLQYTENYKYLGILFNEHLQDKPCIEALTGAATRSFGCVVNLFKQLKNMGINSHTTLYDSYVLAILNYGTAVWGFGEYTGPQVLSNRIKRFFLGINSFTPVASVSLEFDWLDVKYIRWVEMVRLVNRIKKMPESRWPRKILRWDVSLKAGGWSDQVQHVLQYANFNTDLLSEEIIDLDALRSRLLVLNRQKWLLEASDKTKLRTFLQIYDSEAPRSIVESLLTRSQRSIVSKLKNGVLPLHIETGRWKDKPLEHRTCPACDSKCL